MSAGSSPAGIAATRRRSLRLPATRCARSIAARPARSASSASTASSAWPESCCSCSGVIAVPITATASVDLRLVGREHVHVPLDHHRPPRLRDRRARPIDPVKRAALPIQLTLRRVQVLRLRVAAQRPRPEPLHPPPPVAHREHDPGAEAVVVAALPPLLDQPRGRQLGDAEPRPLPARQHLVPGARRVAHPERPQHLLAQTARRQVLTRLAGLLRLPQVAGVELRGPREQPPPACARRFRASSARGSSCSRSSSTP